MFKRKQKSMSMTVDQIKKMNKTPLKYVTERDRETAREIRLGEEGAVNVIDGDFVLVCGGKDVFRAPLDKVTVGELMNLSGFTASFTDAKGGKRTVIAYYSDGHVRVG